MRAGKLDRQITIQRVTTTLDSAGTVQEAWATLTTLRAEKLDDAIDEHTGQQGATTDRTVTFRTRFVAGLTVADQLSFEGQAFNLLQVKEIGRRRGLELRAERAGP
jgi:head-tail adaptor